MKIFTALSGILLACGGVFCYAFQMNSFADLAFVMGLVMLVSGVFCIIAYLISGKANRLPDAMLVESIVTMLFGFAVLNNQVSDAIVSIFFGAWLTMAGATRLSQSVAISRFNPREWARVLPLATLCTLLGAVMTMPTLVSTINALILVGAAFILDGLSQIIYAMYMQQSGQKERAQEAVARAEAKKQASKERSAQRSRLRNLSEREREEALAEERTRKHEAKQQARIEKQQAREAKKANLKDFRDKTVELSDEMLDEINEQAQPMLVYIEPEETEEEVSLYPTFRKPTDIPSLRAVSIEDDAEDSEETSAVVEVKHSAVNLEELEERAPEIEFEPVVLPEVKLESQDKAPIDRDAVLEALNEKLSLDQAPKYTPISLEDLVAEPLKKRGGEADSKRFTNTFTFNWSDSPEFKLDDN